MRPTEKASANVARKLAQGERIAVAIIAAMRNDAKPLLAILDELKTQGLNDYEIGVMFMEIGAIVFNESDVIKTDDTENEEPND